MLCMEKNYRKNYYSSDDSGKVFLFAVLIIEIFSFLFSYIVAGIGRNDATVMESVWCNIVSGLLGPIAFSTLFFIYNKLEKISFSSCEFKIKIGWRNTFIAVFVGLLSLFGFLYFSNCLDYLFVLMKYPLQIDWPLPLDNIGWFMLNLLIFALLPALFEELVFRGMVLKGLQSSVSSTKAIVLSALMFALMHGNLQQLPYTFILGLIIGWVVVRTGSTFSGFLVHFTNNFIVVLWTYIFGSQPVIAPLWWEIVLAVALPLATILLLWLIEKFAFKGKANKTNSDGPKPLSIFVWVSIAVAGVILTFNTILNCLGG